MWIFKSKGAHTLKICGSVPFEVIRELPVEKAIPLVMSGNTSCPKVKLSRTAVRIKDDYHSKISLSKSLLKNLQL